jgi:hypothetical protein
MWPNPFFAKTNAQLLTWKNLPQNLGYFCKFLKYLPNANNHPTQTITLFKQPLNAKNHPMQTITQCKQSPNAKNHPVQTII